MGYGAEHAARPPFFVVTHEPPADVRLQLDFRFVADVPTAIEQAKAVAGDKDVFVMGGGDIIRQSVDAGLVDELALHLSPVVLGAGTPLFVDATRRGSCSGRSDRPAPPSTSPTTCGRHGRTRCLVPRASSADVGAASDDGDDDEGEQDQRQSASQKDHAPTTPLRRGLERTTNPVHPTPRRRVVIVPLVHCDILTVVDLAASPNRRASRAARRGESKRRPRPSRPATRGSRWPLPPRRGELPQLRALSIVRRRGVALPQVPELPQEIAGQARLHPDHLDVLVPSGLQALSQSILARC